MVARPSRESQKNALISTRWVGKVGEHERHLGLMTRLQPQMQQTHPDLEGVIGENYHQEGDGYFLHGTE